MKGQLEDTKRGRRKRDRNKGRKEEESTKESDRAKRFGEKLNEKRQLGDTKRRKTAVKKRKCVRREDREEETGPIQRDEGEREGDGVSGELK